MNNTYMVDFRGEAVDFCRKYFLWIEAAFRSEDAKKYVIRPEVYLFICKLKVSNLICIDDMESRFYSLQQGIREELINTSQFLSRTSLYRGAPGLVLMLGYSDCENGEDLQMNSVKEDIASAIRFNMDKGTLSETDLISGLVGIAWYLLHAPHDGWEEDIHIVFREIVRRCYKVRDFDISSVAYDRTNLGLAHGIVGVLSLASAIKCSDLDIANEGNHLANSVAKFLLSVMKDDGPPFFPYRTGKSERTRVGWCYGDLSALIGLSQYCYTLSNPDWLYDPINTIFESLAQRSGEGSGVSDASVCHGSLGNAYQFALLHQLAGGSQAKRLSDFWWRFFWKNDASQLSGKLRGTSLLTGYSGAGLVMIDALVGLSRDWPILLSWWNFSSVISIPNRE